MPKKRYDIVAMCYDRRGHMLSIAHNSYIKTSPVMKQYALRAGKGEHMIYLHAEIRALLKARGHVHTLVIQRRDNKGRLKPSAPCAACRLAIEDFGVECVVCVMPQNKEVGYRQEYYESV